MMPYYLFFRDNTIKYYLYFRDGKLKRGFLLFNLKPKTQNSKPKTISLFSRFNPPFKLVLV